MIAWLIGIGIPVGYWTGILLTARFLYHHVDDFKNDAKSSFGWSILWPLTWVMWFVFEVVGPAAKKFIEAPTRKQKRREAVKKAAERRKAIEYQEKRRTANAESELARVTAQLKAMGINAGDFTGEQENPFKKYTTFTKDGKLKDERLYLR